MFQVIGISALIVILGAIWLLMRRDTARQQGKWGVNLKRVACSGCGTAMPPVRELANWRQALWGGWTCPECGIELDKWGRPTQS
jgi:hypothetical protein